MDGGGNMLRRPRPATPLAELCAAQVSATGRADAAYANAAASRWTAACARLGFAHRILKRVEKHLVVSIVICSYFLLIP
ncbi:hypothetical protein EYF80_046519 [Liparis tanakae]|uniref:Uncharacterized protein n=1 Tax=Liparis tanakae TaxID=230148 RepID=A0A4Z2FQ72_9TELE|nr:hypothetical protein EYF80_046519 [Liparis tanakae]